MLTIALTAFLLFSPIFMLGGNARLNGAFVGIQYYKTGILNFENNAIQGQFNSLFIYLIVFLAVLSRQRYKFDNKYFILFLLYCFVGLFGCPKGIGCFENIFLYFLLYYFVSTGKTNFRFLSLAIFFVSMLNTVFALGQFFDINWLFKPVSGIGGLMRISNHLGIFQALSLPIIYALNPYLAFIPLLGLMLSKCATAILASIVGMSYLLWQKRHKMGIVNFLAFVSIFLVFAIRNYQWAIHKLFIRIWVWKQCLVTSFHRILNGYGLINYTSVRADIGFFSHPYSIYLALLYSTGIIGLMFFSLAVIENFRKSRNRVIKSSCLIMLICGLTQTWILFPRLLGISVVLFGLLERSKYENDKDKIYRR